MLNNKVRQLAEGLHVSSEGLGALKEISVLMAEKANILVNQSTGYVPDETSEGESPNASYVDGVNERTRIVPTPDNYQELLQGDVPQVQRKAKDNTPKVDPALIEQQAKEEETKKTRTRKSTKKTSKKRSRKFGSFGS